MDDELLSVSISPHSPKGYDGLSFYVGLSSTLVCTVGLFGLVFMSTSLSLRVCKITVPFSRHNNCLGY